jgi:hypothetical protein
MAKIVPDLVILTFKLEKRKSMWPLVWTNLLATMEIPHLVVGMNADNFATQTGKDLKELFTLLHAQHTKVPNAFAFPLQKIPKSGESNFDFWQEKYAMLLKEIMQLVSE